MRSPWPPKLCVSIHEDTGSDHISNAVRGVLWGYTIAVGATYVVCASVVSE